MDDPKNQESMRSIFETLTTSILDVLPHIISIIEHIDRWMKKLDRLGEKTDEMKATVVLSFKEMVDFCLSKLGLLLDAAVLAFGWIPDIGPKIEAARDRFNASVDSMNRKLDDYAASLIAVHLLRDEDYSSHSHGEHTSSGRATGGIAGGLTMVGERGRELVRLPQGSTVIPNGTTEAMMSGASGGGYGGGATRVLFDTTGAEDDFKRLLRKWVRLEGGGNVQAAFGKV